MLKKFSIIKNYHQLNLSPQRKIALEAIEIGLNEVKTENVLKNNLKYITNIEKFNFLAIGKCALDSALFFEKEMINKIENGFAYDISQTKLKTKKIKILTGHHPFPTFQNIKNTKKIINFLKTNQNIKNFLIIISGGGSALLTLPKNNAFKKENFIIKTLMENGANIEEINTLRKHLSYARGGFLAKYLYPKEAIVFIFSDVFSNDLQFISSGPTVKDKTTLKDAIEIIKKYKIEQKIKFDIKKFLIETPKQDKYFKNIKNILVASNQIALKKIKAYLTSKHYKTKIVTSKLNENNQIVAKKIALSLKKLKPKSALIYGGETTTHITSNKGKGGRNQELALKVLEFIQKDELILAINSDGLDNTEFAGAISDKITLLKTKKLNINPHIYLKNNDSFNFFKKTKDFILTGPTHINIADIIIALKN